MIRSARTFLALMIGAALLTAADSRSATFTRMDSVLDDPRSVAVLWELSGDGSTAVGTLVQDLTNPETQQEAIRWTREGGIQRLGILPGGRISEAYIVTPDGGRIAGYSESTAGLEAFLWDEASGMQPLEAPATERSDGIMPGPLTADGRTMIGRRRIGWAFDEGSGSDLPIYEAYVWTANGGIHSLGEIDPNLASASLSGISRDGTTLFGLVGGTDSFDFGHGPIFIRTEGHPLEIVELPPSATPVVTTFVRVSSDGSTILAQFLSEEGGTARFETEIFTHEKGWVRLPDDLGENAVFHPGTLSADGRLVGGFLERFVLGAFERTAVIWDSDHGLRPLKEYLESQGLNLTGIDLTHTMAISDDGSTIAGILRDSNGRSDSFVAVIPEPGPGLLLGMGLAALRVFARPASATTARCVRGNRHSGDR